MRPLCSHPNPNLRRWALPANVQNSTVWYRFWRVVAGLGCILMWRIRVFNRHHEPTSGSVLYISNHQSFMDPMLGTCMLQRPISYMARDSLFHPRLFAWYIRSLNTFPVHRGTADTGAVREAMRRLKARGQLMVFPEGTRTRDGRIGPLLPGVSLLARRAADWVVPMVIDGAFEAWPRTRRLPGPGYVVVQYGRPISQAKARAMKPRAFMAYVRREMIVIQSDIRRRLGRSALKYDE